MPHIYFDDFAIRTLISGGIPVDMVDPRRVYIYIYIINNIVNIIYNNK